MEYIILRGMSGFTEEVRRHLHVIESIILLHHGFKFTSLFTENRKSCLDETFGVAGFIHQG